MLEFQWAMQGNNTDIFYVCEIFFGMTLDNKIFTGECSSNTCLEIAHQLFAIKKGWA